LVVAHLPIYLDHAATCWPRRPGVDAALRDALQAPLGNPGRGGHGHARTASAAIERARTAVAQLVGADDPRRVCLTPSCTLACHLAIAGVLDAWAVAREAGAAPGARPSVVASSLEHNAVARPLAEAAARGAIDLRVIDPRPDGVVEPAAILSACDGTTALVCLTHASNVIGTIQLVAAVAAGVRALRADGAGWPILFCDAAQTAGVIAHLLHETGADLIALGAHKGLGGPTGAGALVVGPGAWREATHDGTAGADRWIEPVIHGGTGADAADTLRAHGHAHRATPRRLPDAFEPGTPGTLALIGMDAAARSLDSATLAREHSHALTLIDQLRDGLRDLPGVRIACDVDDVAWRAQIDRRARVGVLSLTLAGYSPHDAAGVLDASFGIAVRAGLHCAPWCHRWLGTTETGGTVRVSVGPTTTPDEIDALLKALRAMA
jgi:cysteine desulfurase/selenocysteine lyase